MNSQNNDTVNSYVQTIKPQDVNTGDKSQLALKEDKSVWRAIEDFLREFRMKMVKPIKIPVYWGNPFRKQRY